MNRMILFLLQHRIVAGLLLLIAVGWGLANAPFQWRPGFLPGSPVPVDAIPDIGENQQIVFTPWPGRSPQDIDDQITYPLTTYLLGIPGVKSIRSTSIFGFSSIYVIFDDGIEFYWSRSRLLEKLNSLPGNLLPGGVQPALGPDATALGQVFWYTLEGRTPDGKPAGGWSPDETRRIQDFYVKYALNAAEGVSEVASIGGYVQEYQIDVDPTALQGYGIGLDRVMMAVKNANRDAGAKTIEVNQAEYLVRGLGYLKSLQDLELAVVGMQGQTPICLKDVARISLGPATRRGALDKGGAEASGGVVVARYGSNPLAVIDAVKAKIAEISPGLPKKTLSDGTISQLTIVPFYDRTELIQETLGTLESALLLEVLITVLVVVALLANLKASLLISSLLPIAVLMVFVAMRQFGIDANIVALSGIAIAIGTMVDLGIVLAENVAKRLRAHPGARGETLTALIGQASQEVSSAIVTAVATTIVSFIPVFALEAAEGKLFRPLAFTKTFALLASLLVALFLMPAMARWIFGIRRPQGRAAHLLHGGTALAGIALAAFGQVWAGLSLAALGLAWALRAWPKVPRSIGRPAPAAVAIAAATALLAREWLPLGPSYSAMANFGFVAACVGIILGGFQLLERHYESLLRVFLGRKKTFLAIPALLCTWGASAWLGFAWVFGWLPPLLDPLFDIRMTKPWVALSHALPGMGEEFMPALDEGSFLLMPTSMPHAGMAENLRVLRQLDLRAEQLPEVEMVVGKLGRAESALDPAPISMYENIIQYKPEYALDADGRRRRFAVTEEGDFLLAAGGSVPAEDALALGIRPEQLVPDERGQYFRLWRPHISSPDDIWAEIAKATELPGVTNAPKLQPIETRLVMLQTGMRAPMGIKVYGPDLPTIEAFGLKLEGLLKQVPSVKAAAVFADRVVGKPYLQLRLRRDMLARYGLSVEQVQQLIETAIGGMPVTTTVEGRERYPVRVRYPRELRDSPDALARILVPTPMGMQVPLGDLVEIEYQRGPQAIKSENTFLVSYVLFDKMPGRAEVEVVEEAQRFIQGRIDQGELQVPAGVSFRFSGSYENQVRAEAKLAVIVPLVLAVVWLILYLQFKSTSTTWMVFSGVAMACSGGFLMLWLYGQPWFLDVQLGDIDLRTLFQVKTVNLSVAVWVGFIALFGIATDDGVLMATYLDQQFAERLPQTPEDVREAVVAAGKARIKPAIMTSATTIIALLPVLTATGRGADIMLPMAIPSFGGMIVAAITYFITPLLYSWREERRAARQAASIQP